MSASPSTAPGAQRKKQPVSIFAPKRKPLLKRQAQPPTHPSANPPNGVQHAPPAQHAHTNGAVAAAPPPKDDDGDWQEFPIYVSKDTLMRGLHYHGMKLQGKVFKHGQYDPINPYDQTQFTRPMHLHRRLARDKMAQAEQPGAASGVDDKERELINIRREERQREREANQAQIAPTGGESKKPTRQKPKKKVEDVYFNENDEKQTKKSKIRYEESRPWHLEDSEGKNVWVGNYEEPPSEESVMFEIGTGGFRMVPVEKWYRFTQTNRTKVLDSEAVEKEMAKKPKMPRWLLKTQENNDESRRQTALRRQADIRAMQRGGDEPEEAPVVKDEYNADIDELDIEFDDEFQDDDEGMVFGEDADEAKETENKMRGEWRNAGLGATGIKDEDKDYDAEEEKLREERKAEKRMTKSLRKALLRKERKNEYDDDSEHGEFSESSDSEDSEQERERVEQERKQEEARKVNGEKSGASTKGTATPSGRTEKRDASKAGQSLKRPGSPDLSEVSGNESSRKRPKVNGTAAPNGARALSPDTARGSRPPRSTAGGSGSGSETETSKREGRPKLRLRNSPPASPSGSRTGTPTGSRAQSPQRNKRPPFPTLEEVRAAIPAEGIAIGDLVGLFRSRVLGRQGDFIPLVKSAGRQDPVSKKIMPKTQAEIQQLLLQQQGS